jgi:hypothetical protein
MRHVVEDRAWAKNAETPSSLKNLKKWGRRLHPAIVASTHGGIGHERDSGLPCV